MNDDDGDGEGDDDDDKGVGDGDDSDAGSDHYYGIGSLQLMFKYIHFVSLSSRCYSPFSQEMCAYPF